MDHEVTRKDILRFVNLNPLQSDAYKDLLYVTGEYEKIMTTKPDEMIQEHE